MDADFTGLDGVHVLVVEDSDDSREALRLILTHCGALVTTAGTADEAYRLLALLRPHVLVTDVEMPQDRLGIVRAVQAPRSSTRRPDSDHRHDGRSERAGGVLGCGGCGSAGQAARRDGTLSRGTATRDSELEPEGAASGGRLIPSEPVPAGVARAARILHTVLANATGSPPRVPLLCRYLALRV